MTLRQKLGITFAALLVLVGVQAGMAVFLLDRVVGDSALLVEPALSRVDNLAHLEAELLRLRTIEHSFMVEANPALRRAAAREMDELRVEIQRRVQAYGSLELDEARGEGLAHVAQEYEAYLASLDRVIRAVERGDTIEAVGEYLRFQPQFQALDDHVHALRHEEYRATEAMRDQMVQGAAWARWPLGVIVVLVAVAELGLGWYLSRSIARSLEVLQEGARRIAREEFEQPVPMPSERELAALAETLNAVMVTLAANKAERERLEEERVRLLRERLSQVVRAQEEERARVSRELHDQAGQALTALQYGLSRVQRLAGPEAKKELDRLVALAAEAGRQVAALARDLRPAVLDDLGLVPALRSYIREFSERIGIEISFSQSGAVPRMSSHAETTVFRVVQEALTNVAKHARAQHAWVRLSVEDGQLHVEVQDDGRGFDVKGLDRAGHKQKGLGPGLGLAGIQERVQLLGGMFIIHSEEGKGTRLLVSFPVEADASAPLAPGRKR